MITEYIAAAMQRAKYKILEDGAYFGWIEDLSGVWSNGTSLNLCQQELQSVVEDWLLLGLKLGHHITPLDGIELLCVNNGVITDDLPRANEIIKLLQKKNVKVFA